MLCDTFIYYIGNLRYFEDIKCRAKGLNLEVNINHHILLGKSIQHVMGWLITVVIQDSTLLVGVLVTIYHGQWGVQFISHLMI